MIYFNSLIFVLVTASISLANNTYFLPGDAFCYVRLDLKSASRLNDDQSSLFQYGSTSNGSSGCGTIGYQNIQLSNMTSESKNALIDAYHRFQKEVVSDPELGGMMSVFIYSRDYDWKKYAIGVQYNEDWAEESIAFGTIREFTQIGQFSSSALLQNWRDSKLVDKLPAKCPELPAENRHAFPSPWTKTPVTIDASECCFIVIPNRDFQSYIYLSPGLKIIEIVDGTSTFYKRVNGEWKPKR